MSNKSLCLKVLTVWLILPFMSLAQIIVSLPVPKEVQGAKIVSVYGSMTGIISLSRNNITGIYQRLPAQGIFKPLIADIDTAKIHAYGPYVPGSQFLYIGNRSATWKTDYKGSVEKVMAKGDSIAFKLWEEAGTRTGKIVSYCCVAPSLDGTREYVQLLIEDLKPVIGNNLPPRFTGIFEKKKTGSVGIFDKGIVFEQAAPLRNPWTGVFMGSYLLIDKKERPIYVDWQDMGTGFATDDRFLARHDPSDKSSTILIRKNYPFSGERVDWWNFFPDFKNGEAYVWYISGSNQKIVKITDDKPVLVASTGQEIGSWGKPFAIPHIVVNETMGLVDASYKPRAFQHDIPYVGYIADAVGFWDPFTGKTIPLIRQGDRLPDGKIVSKLDWLTSYNTISSVGDCEGDLVITTEEGMIDSWLRVLRTCIKKAPANVFAGQEFVLEGKNFTPGGLAGNSLTEVLIDNLAIHSSQVIQVSDIKATVKAPVTLGGHTVQVRVSCGGRTSLSNVVNFNILPLPPPPPLPVTVAAITSLMGEVKPSFAPGEIITIWGKDMALKEKAWDGNLPLPTELGCKVIISSLAYSAVASLYYCSNTQVNAVLPQDIPLGRYALVVERLTSSGSAETRSQPVNIEVVRTSPTFLGNSLYPVFLQNISQDPTGNTFVAGETPVKPGDVLIMYVTGLGLTEPPLAKGMAANAAVLVPIEVLVQGYTVELLGVASSPQYPGLYQIAFRVLEGIRPDENGSASLEVKVDGKTVKAILFNLA